MGQTLAIPEVTDSGTIGIDYFLNNQQMSILQRSGISIDHVLNPYSFPRLGTTSETKKEIVHAPEILNLPTHITPKSLSLITKQILDSTQTLIKTHLLQFQISTTLPAQLTIHFFVTQPQFTTAPTIFQHRHPLLQSPIEITIHPCINEIVQIILPQCFIEYLAFERLCQTLETQNTDLNTFFGLYNQTTSTLFAQVFNIQHIPIEAYLELYQLSKSVSSILSHISLTMQTLIPTTTAAMSSSSSTHNNSSLLTSSPTSSSTPTTTSTIPFQFTEWLTIQLKTIKAANITANQLREIVQNYQITGDELYHNLLTVPCRDSILYSSIDISLGAHNHHIQLSNDCLELLDLYGFVDNEGSKDPMATTLSLITPDPTLPTNQNNNNENENEHNLQNDINNISTNSTTPVLPTPHNDTINIDDNPYADYPYLQQIPNDCLICMTTTATHVIYPCRHLSLCHLCAKDLIKKVEEARLSEVGVSTATNSSVCKCPVCRQPLLCIFNLSNQIYDTTTLDENNDIIIDDDNIDRNELYSNV